MNHLAPGGTIPAVEAAWIARYAARWENDPERRRLLTAFARAIEEGDEATRLRAVEAALALGRNP